LTGNRSLESRRVINNVDSIRCYYDTLVWVDNQNQLLIDETASTKESQLAEKITAEQEHLSAAQPQ